MARTSTRSIIGLTPRQREVWELAKAEFTNAEIAEQLGLSLNTVRSHMRSAGQKIPATRRRPGRRGEGRRVPRLSRAESEVLEAILQSPLVGEVAGLLKVSPRSCRKLLESIVSKVARDQGARTAPENRLTRPIRQSAPSLQARRRT